jgi:hypothetical protein
MKLNRTIVAGIALLAFAGSAFADTVVITTPQPRPPSKTVIVKPTPNPITGSIRAVTKPDCDTTKKTVEGPRKTTTTVKRDCD